MEIEIKSDSEIKPVEKKTRGRPVKEKKQKEESKTRGRPKTDKPLTERRKFYDLRFSLRKLDLTDDEIKQVSDLIDKLKKDKNSEIKEVK